jgi:tripartite-type tricarboxylate transporter receptor subunit TctC
MHPVRPHHIALPHTVASLVLAACTVLANGLAASGAQAQSSAAWPNRPIRLIVPFPPGGSADFTARTMSTALQQQLGQPIVIENRAGANGVPGTDAVAKAAPDGYTLLVTDRGALGINPSIYARLPYDPVRDFAHIGIATWGAYLLVANRDFPAQTFADFLRIAREKPGEVNYASIGVGSITQLSFESLANRFGIRLNHVPYKGTAPSAAATVAGETQVTMSTFNAVLGHVKEGRLRALALGATKRSSLFPDVPTIVELGGSADTIAAGFFSLSAPAGTPTAIVNRLSEEASRALRTPEIADRLLKAGLDAHGGSPQELTETVKADVVRFAKLVRDIGIKPE